MQRQDERVAQQDVRDVAELDGAGDRRAGTSQVRSAGETEAITKTATSISEATASAPPTQPRRTGHGSARQRSRAPRVSRMPLREDEVVDAHPESIGSAGGA